MVTCVQLGRRNSLTLRRDEALGPLLSALLDGCGPHAPEAEALRDRILAGEDFTTLAKQYSADSATAISGGDLGWIPWGSLPEPFLSHVGDYPAGTMLEPVAADDGIHIIRVEGRREARPYDLALDRPEITEMARREKTGRMVEEWVEKLRQEIYVEERL